MHGLLIHSSELSLTNAKRHHVKYTLSALYLHLTLGSLLGPFLSCSRQPEETSVEHSEQNVWRLRCITLITNRLKVRTNSLQCSTHLEIIPPKFLVACTKSIGMKVSDSCATSFKWTHIYFWDSSLVLVLIYSMHKSDVNRANTHQWCYSTHRCKLLLFSLH